MASSIVDADIEFEESVLAAFESESKKSQAKAAEREEATDLGLRLKDARLSLNYFGHG